MTDHRQQLAFAFLHEAQLMVASPRLYERQMSVGNRTLYLAAARDGAESARVVTEKSGQPSLEERRGSRPDKH